MASAKQLLLPLGRSESAPSRRKVSLFSCIYCRSPANTRDHVPPQVFLERPFPINYRTVPACQTCNASWSLDEQYMAVVLAKISSHPSLIKKLEDGGIVDRTLMASPKFDAALLNALSVADDGRLWLRIETERLKRIVTKIGYGLFCLTYGHAEAFQNFVPHYVLGPGDKIPDHLVAAQLYWPGTRHKKWTKVQDGIFSYLFAKGWTNADPPLYCLMNFHDTVLAVIACPPPTGRRADKRLKPRPWNR
jgi:hypothetical protein